MRAGDGTLADPADLVREACTLLAGYLPVLEREMAEQSAEGPAPGMHARMAAAPLPGNAPAIFALTGIDASARNLEGILLYAAGKRRAGPLAVRGGSGPNTEQALKAITRLFAKAEGDHDLERLVMSELEQRLNETRCVRAIDEVRRWRPLPGRPCPYCKSGWLKADMDGRPVVIACFYGYCPGDGNGLNATATMGTDDSGVPCLAWADGLVETVPDLDG